MNDATSMSGGSLKHAQPVNVLPLLREERNALLELLTGLAREQWETDTPCPGWTVHDLTAHLLGDDLGVLSRDRDEYSDRLSIETGARATWKSLVESLNRTNEQWVQATRDLSGRLLVELLRYSGELSYEYFRGLDPDGLGDTVSWAGPEPAPHWLNTARQYTERWVHQAQIREALRLPSLDEPRFLSPVIATFTRALSRAYSAQQADEGTCITVSVQGQAGGHWSLRRQSGGWVLYEGEAPSPVTSIRLDQETFWRHLSRDDRSGVRDRVETSGKVQFAEPFFDAVAMITD
jgi:uncharacterized protein (TIGR03083 family)